MPAFLLPIIGMSDEKIRFYNKCLGKNFGKILHCVQDDGGSQV